MKPWVVRVDQLGKQYRLGGVQPLGYNIREAVIEGFKNLFRRTQTEEKESGKFWALQNVSFEIGAGEVVGIIGRNGAGKSTLLKILSRITPPTCGGVEYRGRMASLLEVGTGFHRDLSGRENIYLNGAILGMRRSEIDEKLNEIVAFAGIEKFVDTPVKFYSSGMYVRLAFSVAAHLDADILLIDEVLAVGDADFQKKCLGKMREIAGSGRTVLFVSHNIGAVLSLCSRVILLKNGGIEADGSPNETVEGYFSLRTIQDDCISLEKFPRRFALRENARLNSVKSIGEASGEAWKFAYGDEIRFRVAFEIFHDLQGVEFGAAFFASSGFEIASCRSSQSGVSPSLKAGKYAVDVGFPQMRLSPGVYTVTLSLLSDEGMQDQLVEGFDLEVTLSTLAVSHHGHEISAALVPSVTYSIQTGVSG
jgi:lipopolysaccharide transport system ATP-binding protein